MRIFLLVCSVVLFSNLVFAGAQAQAVTNSKKTVVQWDASNKLFVVGNTKLKLGVDAVCGYYNNQAEYASFGLESQVFKCSKILIPVTVNYKKLFGKIEFAPLYDSIKSEIPNSVIYYGKDSRGRNIQGNNPYFDWYKNLGTRVYYLGDVPLREAYAGIKFTSSQGVIAGRVKNQIGLRDSDTPWDDNGLFSPYAYWLSRNLLSGVEYYFSSKLLGVSTAILSGNNPMKGYANYLGQVQTPNLKANNTPSYSLNVNFNLGHLFNANNDSKLILGTLIDTMNSTWDNALQDGKRRNNVCAAALLLNFNINSYSSLALFSQYTIYMSGLTTDSGQYDPANPLTPLFRNITQQGYFVGLTLNYRAFSASYTYENFDRFDYNVFAKWVNNPALFSQTSLLQLENLRQSSNIFNLKWQFNSVISVLLNYQTIQNPLEWVSSISDRFPTYRAGIEVDVKF